MIDLMIERWNQRDGSEDVLWSIWQDGSRIHMGGPSASVDAAEAEGRAWCEDAVGSAPDRVTHL